MEPLDFEVVTEGLSFPEGPVVMDDGSVIVVEMTAGRITRCLPDGRTQTVAEPGGGPNGAAIGPDGALYLCNNGGIDLQRRQCATGPGSEGRIERVDIGSGRVERVYDAWNDTPLSAPNDIVFAADGQFWFTDLGKEHDCLRHFGGLYRAGCEGASLERIHYGPVSFNGVGLSPDGTTAYVADTHAARLYAFDAKASAVPIEPRLVATAPGRVQLDSLGVTASGTVCVGQLRPGGIVCFHASGEIRVVPLPDPLTTNIAFGGPGMRTAWITQSQGGRLLRCRWPEAGLRLAFNG